MLSLPYQIYVAALLLLGQVIPHPALSTQRKPTARCSLSIPNHTKSVPFKTQLLNSQISSPNKSCLQTQISPPMEREASSSSENSRRPPTLSSSRIRTRSDPLLIVCRCFSFITAVVAVLCVLVNLLSAVRSFKNGSDIFGGIFRCYAVLIALFAAVAETEWSFIMKFWRIFEYWAGRGMLQIFVAVMTRAFPDVSGERRDLVLLQEIASYLLAACGLTYVISGVLCIGFLKRARQHKEITREQAAQDLEELERRREELEVLLMQENA